MQVFKLYFKIIKKRLPSMIIYFGIFLAMAVAFSLMAVREQPSGFKETKIKAAVVNEDEGSEFSKAFTEYISRNMEIVKIGDTRESIQDALFYREISYFLRIPKGFSADFLKGSNNIPLEKTSVPDSASSVQADFLISRYLNLARGYSASIPGIEPGVLVRYVEGDMEQEAQVSLRNAQNKQDKGMLYYYLSYYSYSVMAIMVLGVISIMMVVRSRDIRRRNAASPMGNLSQSLQLMLGNLVFTILVWGLLSAVAFIIYPDEMKGPQVLPSLANALVYTLVSLCLSFLAGNFIKTQGAKSAVSNVLSLGLCFISGVFVPQELLGATVQKIASFTPTYWYISAVNTITSLSNFSFESMKPAIYAMLIQLGFAAAFLIVALATSRYKLTAEE